MTTQNGTFVAFYSDDENFIVFYSDENNPGWYWAIEDIDNPMGPYKSYKEAIAAATNGG